MSLGFGVPVPGDDSNIQRDVRVIANHEVAGKENEIDQTENSKKDKAVDDGQGDKAVDE